MPNIILYLLLFFSLPSLSSNASYSTCEQANSAIQSIFQNLDKLRFKDFASRISFINKQFINKPYLFNALGEGENGEFDKEPLYRVDAFDCETYVDTITALSLSNNLSEFKQYMRRIRYKEGKISFITRNHFTCLDWNLNNQKQGITKDITTTIHNKNNKIPALIAIAYIDKPNWYKNMSIDRIRIPNSSETKKEEALAKLKEKGKKLAKVKSSIPYIPLTDLFKKSGKANMAIFKQIPNGSIIEIIRPNWNLYSLIGTNLNVSHLGFVIWDDEIPYFIHASSTQSVVVKTPLIEYLRHSLNSPTIKGINIQIIIQDHIKNAAY